METAPIFDHLALMVPDLEAQVERLTNAFGMVVEVQFDSFALVTDPYAWLYMYSAAAVGWLLFLGFPGVVAMLRVLNAKRRIYLLREQQKNLINEWGDSILPAAEAAKTENRN